ncbi:MAG: hypothetical protein ACKVOO_11575 [Burkholderiaceae bacterium]
MKKTHTPKGAYRYSPKPVQDYDLNLGGLLVGPGQSPFLAGSFEAWNLAYLSHDFEAEPVHPNPGFTTACRATTNYFLDQGVVDLIGNGPAHMKVQGLLRRNPEDFLRALTRHPNHKKTALYLLLGATWIGIMQSRLDQCARNPAKVLLESMDLEPTDFALAESVLSKF